MVMINSSAQVAAAAIINRNISRHEENVKFAAFLTTCSKWADIQHVPTTQGRGLDNRQMAETTITRMEEMQIPLLESSIGA